MTNESTNKANNSHPSTTPRRKNAALNAESQSPYQQRTTQRENPVQQLIKQSVEFLLKQLEAGKSEILTGYLACALACQVTTRAAKESTRRLLSRTIHER